MTDQIALEHDLSVYDAVSFDVAIRYRAHLMSRDARIMSIAKALGIRPAFCAR